jgi:hypothetical protein
MIPKSGSRFSDKIMLKHVRGFDPRCSLAEGDRLRLADFRRKDRRNVVTAVRK